MVGARFWITSFVPSTVVLRDNWCGRVMSSLHVGFGVALLACLWEWAKLYKCFPRFLRLCALIDLFYVGCFRLLKCGLY